MCLQQAHLLAGNERGGYGGVSWMPLELLLQVYMFTLSNHTVRLTMCIYGTDAYAHDFMAVGYSCLAFLHVDCIASTGDICML